MKCLFSSIFSLLAALLYSTAGQAEALPEYAMKAAFVYNFTLFTDWPSLPNNTLQICTLESNQLKQELDNFSKNQPHGAKLVIRKIYNLNEIKQCQALFLTEEDKQRIPEILEYLDGNPILTITDIQDLIGKGAIIGMKIENKRIVFEVDTVAAKKSGLHLNSRLLSLAKTVY